MYRLVYYNDVVLANVPPNAGPIPKQHWLVSHTVTGSAGQNAVRWYEFTTPQHTVVVTDLTIGQQGTYAPDSNHRWLSSMARDKAGNILVGYSVSSSSVYPEIAVAGRSATDPPGTLGAEQVIYAGTASDDEWPRWGDYSSVALDASDGCTLWYVNEYRTVSDPHDDWSTRLASMKFPNCTP